MKNKNNKSQLCRFDYEKKNILKFVYNFIYFIIISFESNRIDSIRFDSSKFSNRILILNSIFDSTINLIDFFIFVVFVMKFLHSTMICIVIWNWFIWFSNQINYFEIQFYTIAILILWSNFLFFVNILFIALIIQFHRHHDITFRINKIIWLRKRNFFCFSWTFVTMFLFSLLNNWR